MFEAFPKNGRTWEKEVNKQKPKLRRFWPHCFLGMFGSGKPYGKVSLLLNLPIKLVPTQTYMYRFHAEAFPVKE